MAEQKDNTGVLFANDKKNSDRDPDGKGSATIGGIEYWVSSWVNRSKSGHAYKTLRFTPKNQPQSRQSPRPAPAAAPKPAEPPADAGVISDEQKFTSGDIPF